MGLFLAVARAAHLLLAILHQLCLHGEAPHDVQGVPGKFHLVEDLATHLHHLMSCKLGGERLICLPNIIGIFNAYHI